MDATKRLATKTYRHFMHDSLYRNTIYLIVNNLVLAGAGFIFWIIAAHLYSPAQVGITTTLIAVTSVLSLFSFLGLNNALVRFLPNSKSPNELIDSSVSAVSITSALVAIIFVIGINVFVPQLAILRRDPLIGAGFVVYIIFATQNTLTNSVFLAYKSTVYTLISNISFAICKLVLPFLFISVGGGGLFLAHAGGIVAGTTLSFYYLAHKFHYIPAFKIHLARLKEIARFSFGNYISNFMVSAPAMLLPIVVTNRLGTRESAYFYIAFTFANLIYVIPNVATNSLFAEGSNDEAALRYHAVRSFKFIMAIVIPASVATFVGAPLLLKIFGHSYSSVGTELLRIFSVATFFITINYIAITVLQVKLRMAAIITITTIGAMVIVGSALILARRSLNDIALSWLLGQMLMSLLFVLYIAKTFFHKPVNKLPKPIL